MIALGLYGRGLSRGRGLLDMDYMSVACGWAWIGGARLVIGLGMCGRGLWRGVVLCDRRGLWRGVAYGRARLVWVWLMKGTWNVIGLGM